MKEKIYFITGNAGKFKEAKEIFPQLERLEIDLTEIQSMNSKEVIEAKLKEAFNYHKGPFIVEDISVSFDCLNGLPGPLIKWFLKTIGNQGMYKTVQEKGDNKATVTCSIGYAKDPKTIKYFQASIKGEIVKPSGTGFGWDPIFKPAGYDKTFGEMTAVEKNAISMRKLALTKLEDFIQKT
jgi:inosine triphosphate pyrophosphatase